MAISIDEEYKNSVGCKITLRFAEAIQQGEIPSHDLESVSRFVTGSLGKVNSKEELLSFLRSLAIRWPSFESVFHHEIQQIQTANSIQDNFTNRSQK